MPGSRCLCFVPHIIKRVPRQPALNEIHQFLDYLKQRRQFRSGKPRKEHTVRRPTKKLIASWIDYTEVYRQQPTARFKDKMIHRNVYTGSSTFRKIHCRISRCIHGMLSQIHVHEGRGSNRQGKKARIWYQLHVSSILDTTELAETPSKDIRMLSRQKSTSAWCPWSEACQCILALLDWCLKRIKQRVNFS